MRLTETREFAVLPSAAQIINYLISKKWHALSLSKFLHPTFEIKSKLERVVQVSVPADANAHRETMTQQLIEACAKVEGRSPFAVYADMVDATAKPWAVQILFGNICGGSIRCDTREQAISFLTAILVACGIEKVDAGVDRDNVTHKLSTGPMFPDIEFKIVQL